MAKTKHKAPLIWHCRGHEVLLGSRVALMGVLNVTPDSFSDGGRFADVDRAIEHALALVEEGACFIDVGGESTRPGAQPVDETTECERVVPVIAELARRGGALLSVDTRKARVARAALEAGAHIINDVSAFRQEEAPMLELARESGCGCILMHMQGTPETMQQAPGYQDVVGEVSGFLGERIAACVAAGLAPTQLAIDPGLGFGKTAGHNYRLLACLDTLLEWQRPVLVGLSRKSMLGAVTGRPVEERLAASIAGLVCAAERGAHVMRVHDVRASYDAVCVVQAVHDVQS